MTTVYRTLDLLVSWSVVLKFDFGEGRSRYELIEHPNGLGHHHHLICCNCKSIINYTDLIDKEIELLTNLEKDYLKDMILTLIVTLLNFMEYIKIVVRLFSK